MQKIMGFNKQKEDKSYLEWAVSRQSSGTAGSFLKAYEEVNGKKLYYKASNYDASRGFYGHESLNEIVACNLAEMMGMYHLRYRLVDGIISVPGRGKQAALITASEDYKYNGEYKMTLESFYETERLDDEDVLTFISRMDLQDYFYDMFLLDWIICNRDRHGANVEVLIDSDWFRMAPLFDHGLSFAFSCYGFIGMDEFDVMKDSPVNNFVGSCILSDNLKLVPGVVLSKVEKIEYTHVFDGIREFDVPQIYFDTIEKMIKERVQYVKTIQNKK